MKGGGYKCFKGTVLVVVALVKFEAEVEAHCWDGSFQFAPSASVVIVVPSCPSPHQVIESFHPAVRQFQTGSCRLGYPKPVRTFPTRPLSTAPVETHCHLLPTIGPASTAPALQTPSRYVSSCRHLHSTPLQQQGPTYKMFSLDINWWGLVIPLSYVIVLGGSLMSFSTIYRKRKAGSWHFT
jgi:hypothetical protein